jgi:hypothetical protein
MGVQFFECPSHQRRLLDEFVNRYNNARPTPARSA